MGAGKSYCMVSTVHRRYYGRREIFSNMNLTWATQIETIDDMIGCEDGIVMIDEAGTWFNSRNYKAMEQQSLSYFTQTRKQGVHVFYTVQSEAGIDVQIRRITATIHRHTRYGSMIVQTSHDADSGERSSMRLVFIKPEIYKLYDTYEVVGNGRDRSNKQGAMHKRKIKHLLQGAYVREYVDGKVMYRTAADDDVHMGREICKFDASVEVKPGQSKFILVDTSEYQQLGLVKEETVIVDSADAVAPVTLDQLGRLVKPPTAYQPQRLLLEMKLINAAWFADRRRVSGCAANG